MGGLAGRATGACSGALSGATTQALSSVDTPLIVLGSTILHAWYSRVYSTIVEGASGVSSCSDESTNGRDITQSNDSKRPPLGDYYIQQTDNVTQRLKTTSFAMVEGDFAEAFMLAKSATATPTRDPAMLYSSSNTGGGGGALQLAFNGGEYDPLAVLNGSPDKVANLTTQVSEVPDTKLHVWRQRIGDDLHEWEDYGVGTWSRTASGAAGLGEAQTEFSVGSSSPYDSLCFPVHWAEMVVAVTPAGLTTQQRDDVMAFMVARGEAIAADTGDTLAWAA